MIFYTEWNAITSGTSEQEKSCPEVIIKTIGNSYGPFKPKELKAYLGYEKEVISPLTPTSIVPLTSPLPSTSNSPPTSVSTSFIHDDEQPFECNKHNKPRPSIQNGEFKRKYLFIRIHIVYPVCSPLPWPYSWTDFRSKGSNGVSVTQELPDDFRISQFSRKRYAEKF